MATDLDMANKIRAEGFYNSHVMHTLEHLTVNIGPRLTGSPQMDEANRWTKERLEQWGLKNAHLDPFEFGRGWSFDSININMTAPRKVSLHGLPMAWTPGTSGTVSGEVVYFDPVTEQELQQYKGKLNGKILMMSQPKVIKEPKNKVFERYNSKALTKMDDFDVGRHASHGTSYTADKKDKSMQAYLFNQKLNQFLKAEKVAAVLYRSYRQGGIVDARGKTHRVGETFPVPSVVLAAEHYQLLMRLIDNDKKPQLSLNVVARFHDQDTKAYNTMAEIPGKGRNPEIVMLGGHLDSWHGSGGAVDNAAGVAVSMEAMRILTALGVKPERTIRVALWSGEEQGLYGSRAYVDKKFATRPKPKSKQERELPRRYWHSRGWPIQPKKAYDKFSVYFNMDAGSGRFRGIHTEGNVAVHPIFSKWFRPYSDLSAGKVVNKADNYTDHEAFDDVGLPGFQFIQDPLDYFSRLHHTHLDSFDHVIENDLKQASVIMASFIYNAAMADERIPRKPMPTEPSWLQQQKTERAVEKARRLRERDGNKALDTKPYRAQ
jgi:hypothetical protein